jgi:hypothetical protein
MSESQARLGLSDEGAKRAGVAGQAFVGESQNSEEEPGGLALESAADQAGYDFGEGTLDGVAVVEAGQVEGGRSGASSAWATGTAGGMVVVAELFAAEGRGAARVAGGVDVMAIGESGVVHGELRRFVRTGLNGETRLAAGFLVSCLLLKYTGWSISPMPTLFRLF